MVSKVYGDRVSREIEEAIKVKTEEKRYGVAFPAGKTKENIFSKEYGSSVIFSQLKQLLLVDRGERVMLPGYGINIRSYLFDNITKSDLDIMKADIKDQIGKYVPNVEVIDIQLKLAQNYKYGGLDAVLVQVTLRATKLNQILDFSLEL